MTTIDARLETGELSPRLVLQSELSYGTVLDIEFADGVTVNGSPDAYREFARDLLDLVDMVAPVARVVLDDIPPHPAALDRQDIEDAIGDALSHLALNGDDLTRAAGDVWATIVGAPVPGDTQPQNGDAS